MTDPNTVQLSPEGLASEIVKADGLGSAKAVFAGLAVIDLCYAVGDFPCRDAKTFASGLQVTAGGPALNAAVAFAALGGEAALASAVGSHPLAEIIREDMLASGCHITDLALESRVMPPVSSVISEVSRGGARTIVTIKPEVDPQLSDRAAERILDGAKLLLVDTYYLGAAIPLARRAREIGLPVLLDGGSWKPGLENLLPFVTDAICSENFVVPENDDRDAAAERLLNAGISRIAFTRGANSMIWRTDGDAGGEIAVPGIDAVDTSGAGDFFHGAYARYRLAGFDFREALKAASRVAALSCCFAGSRSWLERLPVKGD